MILNEKYAIIRNDVALLANERPTSNVTPVWDLFTFNIRGNINFQGEWRIKYAATVCSAYKNGILRRWKCLTKGYLWFGEATNNEDLMLHLARHVIATISI